MKKNQDFKNEALAALKGNWTKAVLATLIYFFLCSLALGPSIFTSLEMQEYMQDTIGGSYGSSSVHKIASLITDPAYHTLQARSNGASSANMLLQIFLLVPLTVGYANALRRLLTLQDDEIVKNTFKISFHNYWHKVWGMLLANILLMLWFLLLIIPGIIKTFSYAMTKYILEENPELGASDAIHRSRMMMKGHKFDLFWLYLSFIGWGLLCILTLGIGFIWLIPYMETAEAAFYEEVKADYALNGGLA